MKAFVCIVLLAAAALAAPEGKRDKRGFLHGHDHGFGGYELGHSLDFGHASIGHSSFGHSSLDHGFGHSALDFDHGYHAPAAHIVSVNKLVEVPKVIEVKKIVSVPKVVSVPQIVKVSKIVEDHHHFAPSHSAGWW